MIARYMNMKTSVTFGDMNELTSVRFKPLKAYLNDSANSRLPDKTLLFEFLKDESRGVKLSLDGMNLEDYFKNPATSWEGVKEVKVGIGKQVYEQLIKKGRYSGKDGRAEIEIGFDYWHRPAGI